MEFFVLALWVAVSIAVGYAAEARGRNGPAWFFLALLISPLLAVIILVAFPVRATQRPVFEAEAFYKGTPYCARAGGQIEAMLPGGRVIFHNLDEFTKAMDGGTIQLKHDDAMKAEFPHEVHGFLYRVEKNGSVSAVNRLGERLQFQNWPSFWNAASEPSRPT